MLRVQPKSSQGWRREGL